MAQELSCDEPATYSIQIQGTLAAHWADYLGGLVIKSDRRQGLPVTTLSGPVLDQAALLGVLNHIYDMGYPLLNVEYRGTIEENGPYKPDKQGN